MLRGLMCSSTVVVAAIALLAQRTAAFGPGQSHWNVLYFVADDLRPEISGGYNQTVAHTPNIDKLAATGTVFNRAYCQQAVCGPSRNSFMTGRRPHHTNVDATETGEDFRVSGIDSGGVKGADWITMPEHFKKHGYATLGGGKTFHPNNPKNFDYPTSWSDWRGNPGAFKTNYFDYAYWLNSAATGVDYKGPCPGFAGPSNTSSEPSGLSGPVAVWCGLDEPDEHFYDYGLANDTISRLQHAAEMGQKDGTSKPFFIQSGFARPHTPWRVPQRFWDLYTTEDIALATHKLPPNNMPGVAWQAHSFYNASTGGVFHLNVTTPLEDRVAQTARHAYYASVSWMDHQIGRILDELDALKLTDNTIVLLHGDHGWQLGEHNSWHKYTNFELGTRVPLIIRAPMIPESIGHVVDGLAELIDVYPTLAELAGTPTPSDNLDGVSLVPFFENPKRRTFQTSVKQGTLNKTVAFSQYPHSDQGVRCPVLNCTFYHDGACHASPSLLPTDEAATIKSGSDYPLQRMGFSVRDHAFRYTVWLPYDHDAHRADWNATTAATDGAPGKMEELYDHTDDDGTNFNAMDTENVAYDASNSGKKQHYFAIAREFFDVIAPPTAPGVVPNGCANWCTEKWTPAKYCGFESCKSCPACKPTTQPY